MPDMKKYHNMAISKKAGELVRHEAKKNRRQIYIEAEILIMEAVDARRRDADKNKERI